MPVLMLLLLLLLFLLLFLLLLLRPLLLLIPVLLLCILYPFYGTQGKERTVTHRKKVLIDQITFSLPALGMLWPAAPRR